MPQTTLLLIDDDERICATLKRDLERTGRYTVHTAAGGAQGVALAHELLPDAILLDMMMPKMTGADVAAALRSKTETAGIPIVFLTGLMGKEDVAALDGVIDGERYLAKPATVEEIYAALSKVARS